MRRSAQVAAAGSLLAMLAVLPALAAACALSCDVRARDAATTHVTCHEGGKGARLTADAPDPCATHDRPAAEPATRTAREHVAAASAQVASSVAGHPSSPALRRAAVTPGPPRPAPTRPPLVLRL